MDLIQDPNMDTQQFLILCVHIGRPSFRDRISFCHDFPFYDPITTFDLPRTALSRIFQELHLGHLLGQ